MPRSGTTLTFPAVARPMPRRSWAPQRRNSSIQPRHSRPNGAIRNRARRSLRASDEPVGPYTQSPNGEAFRLVQRGDRAGANAGGSSRSVMPTSPAPSRRMSSRCRHRTSPARCTWVTPRRSPSRTRSAGSGACAASRSSGVPGTDHAAIATQNVIERQLADEGTTKEELGRAGVPGASRRLVRGVRRADLRADAAHGLHVRLGPVRFTLDDAYVRASAWSSRRCSMKASSIAGHASSTGVHAAVRRSVTRRSTGRSTPTPLYYLNYPVEETAGTSPSPPSGPRRCSATPASPSRPATHATQSLVGKHATLPLTWRVVPIFEDAGGAAGVRHGSAQSDPGARPHRLRDRLRGTRCRSSTSSHPTAPWTFRRCRSSTACPPSRRESRWLMRCARWACRRARGAVYRTRSATAIAAAPSSSRSSASSGGCAWHRLQRRASALSKVARSAFIRRAMPTSTCTGCATSSDWCISRQLWLGHAIPVSTCANGHRFAWIEPPTACADLRRRVAHQRSGRARHLVQQRALALRDLRMARADRRSWSGSTRPIRWSPGATSSFSGSPE